MPAALAWSIIQYFLYGCFWTGTGFVRVMENLEILEIFNFQGLSQFNKTSTSVIYKCSYCFETLKQLNYTWRSLIKLIPGKSWNLVVCLGKSWKLRLVD